MKTETQKAVEEFREKFVEQDYQLGGKKLNSFHIREINPKKLEQFLIEKIQEAEKRGEERERKLWESRGIVTDCHACGKIIHIWPHDAARLMREYYPELKEENNG